MASFLQWMPDSLYNSALLAVVQRYPLFQKEISSFPENILFDVCYKLYKENRLCQLGFEFCHINIFSRVLKVKDKRHLLHHCFQALMDHGARTSELLAESFSQHAKAVLTTASVHVKDHAVKFGLSLGEFLADAGWFPDSEKVLDASLELALSIDDPVHWRMVLDCCLRLIHVRTADCEFNLASETFELAERYICKLKDQNLPVNMAGIYGGFAVLFFSKSMYNEAYKWSLKALQHLSSSLPLKIVVDVLRHAARVCVVKREFKRAELLIKQALTIAVENFGRQNSKTADTLLDYAFYLLNIDSIALSVKTYQSALDIRLCIFGGQNLHVAIAHEDLAYALYVHEYSVGKFDDARDHANKAMSIMTRLLPEDHLLLASSKRVKALILEEIAIDFHDKQEERRLLGEAQELHLTALHLAKRAFGEKNVQTAKHYGNLGRLYQSMQRFKEAEEMHLKAIEIKEQLLGPDDYEVALSVGHLASLYNYDMLVFDKAERLYQQSISIGIKLFGKGYSGLEYDYRGLLRVYMTQGNHEKALEYTNILQQWKQLRDASIQKENQVSPWSLRAQPIQPEDIMQHFMNIQ